MFKKERRLVLLLLVLATVGLLAIGCLGGLYWLRSRQSNQSDYIATLDGEKIELNEYKIYLYLQKKRFESLGGEDIWEMDFDGQTGESLAKQFALDNVVYIKVSLKEAKRQKLVLSEEEREQCLQKAEEQYYAVLQSGEEAAGGSVEYWKKLYEDYELYRKLYQLVTQDFVSDQAGFNGYFQQYYENNRQSLVKVEAQVIRMSPQASPAAREMCQSAAETVNVSEKDFEDLYRGLPESGSADLSYNASTVISAYAYPEEVAEAAYALQPGEVSPLITAGGSSYLLRVSSVTEPDRQALEEEQWEIYTNLQKNEIFDQEYRKWSRNIEVVRNLSVWEEVGLP